ncbi:membrane fusion protein, multidrug efflux system [Andreprevotia lacus DSM 23236]|uniref:Membrane fusion protein, multidrug efflux system n=1 Tax=Andreprevotia lacus DSM 23236 TaxID=1121001 RepID=A0A1W1XIZ9_9NEIS|nr:efflux RND transporter periplasmic adaptor subunit [Andreprevotia lacus]SMC23802.1 membrane fusion protein, multidrug efflux system [Andreprevotia lacus DSM 23236]
MLQSHLRNSILVASIALALAACGKQDAGAGHGAGGQMPPQEVAVITAAAGDSSLTRDLPGRVVAYRSAEVRAQVEGILQKRLYEEGSEVRAGQTLFQIDASTLSATVAANEAALARAQANAEIAKQTLARYQKLVDVEGVSKQELDQAISQNKQAQADLLSADAALKKARIDLAHASVPAPISGRTSRALVSEGTLVGRGEATQLTTIEQLDPIYVNFSQAGSEVFRLKQMMKAGKLKAGAALPVDLLLEDGSVYPVKGKLLFAEQTVDPATGTVTLRAEFANPDRLLLPGMFGSVRLALGDLGGSIRVPQRAVMSSPQGQFVYIVGKENKVAAAPVQTGGMSGRDWIITSGLKGGEQVIVEGLQKIRPDAVVQPAPYQAPGAASAPAAAANAHASAASAASQAK